jgi:small subunit ribosomal protein S17
MAAKTELTGKVISDKMVKSRVVAVERQVRHGVYGKTRRLTSTFMAHDETNDTKAGDVVAMAESRPLSRRKRWVITRVVEAGAAPAETAKAPQR